MKRDKEFLREVMIEIQASETGLILHQLLLAPSTDELKLDHHLDLLMDEGLVARKGKHGFRLTPLGHDAVEMIESKAFWARLRAAAPIEAYDILKGVGSSLAVKALSKLMGWG